MLLVLQNLISILATSIKLVCSKFKTPAIFHIGISKRNFEIDTTKFVYLTNEAESYFADPFLFQKNGITYIFCEKYSYNLQKGIIVVFEIGENNEFIDLGVALEKSYHLSFPFVFEFRSDIYLVPESKHNKNVVLYKNIIWPNQWQQVAIVLDGISAVDSVIFQHNEVWWVLTTFDSAGTNMAQSELHVYFSHELESNNWEKHPKNPVIIDSHTGRNAGFFMDGDRLIRCSQSMKDGQYGSKLNFHEITKLSKFDYLENNLDLDNFSKSHSYDTKYNITVLDTRF